MEYKLVQQVDRFGAEAVLGAGPHPKRLLESMAVAQNVVDAVRQRDASGAWGTWAEKHTQAAELLVWAASLLEE